MSARHRLFDETPGNGGGVWLEPWPGTRGDGPRNGHQPMAHLRAHGGTGKPAAIDGPTARRLADALIVFADMADAAVKFR